MKHVKSQRIFENGEADPIQMLKTLKSRGLISPDEYVRDMLELVRDKGLDPSLAFEPGEVYFNITGDYLDDDEYYGEESIDSIKQMFREFRGPGGEFAIQVKGEMSVEYSEFNVTLSTGAHVHIENHERFWSDTHYYISFDKKMLTLDEMTVTRLTEGLWDGDYEFEEYIHELLKAIVELAY
jgi:hypothetical protein